MVTSRLYACQLWPGECSLGWHEDMVGKLCPKRGEIQACMMHASMVGTDRQTFQEEWHSNNLLVATPLFLSANFDQQLGNTRVESCWLPPCPYFLHVHSASHALVPLSLPRANFDQQGVNSTVHHLLLRFISCCNELEEILWNSCCMWYSRRRQLWLRLDHIDGKLTKFRANMLNLIPTWFPATRAICHQISDCLWPSAALCWQQWLKLACSTRIVQWKLL